MIRYFDTGFNGEGDSLGLWLDQEIVPGLRSFRGQFGFFDISALRPYFPALSELVDAGGVFRLVVGANPGDPPAVSDLEEVTSLLRDPERTSLVVVAFSNALFHPKTLHLARHDGTEVGVVSSANFTQWGLGRSVEAGLFLEAVAGSNSSLADIASAIDQWTTCGDEGVYRIQGADDIAALSDRGIAVPPTVKRSMRSRQAAGTENVGRGRRPVGWRPATQIVEDDETTTGEDAAEPGTSVLFQGESMLMRVRPRRNGKQIAISMVVHRSAFMDNAREVVSAADGSLRPIGYNQASRTNRGAKKTPVKNTARFEAPELEGMTNPVARFRWVDVDEASGESTRGLQYEIFDADSDEIGRALYQQMREDIADPPVTRRYELMREQTVLSTPDPVSAQWYRLVSG